jgi:hypothetical protein
VGSMSFAMIVDLILRGPCAAYLYRCCRNEG